MKSFLLCIFICVISDYYYVKADCFCGRVFPPPEPRPISIAYVGDACECGRPLPYQIDRPVHHQPRHELKNYGYEIELPPPKPIEVKYNFDFQTERPVQPECTTKLCNYGFKVWTPPNPTPVVRYNFDTQVEVPSNPSPCLPMRGLVAQVDQIVLQKEDCDIPVPGDCPCRSCKPIIEKFGLFPKPWPQCCESYGNYYNDAKEDSSQDDSYLPISYDSRYAQNLDTDRFKRQAQFKNNKNYELKVNKNTASIWGRIFSFKSVEPISDKVQDGEKIVEIQQIEFGRPVDTINPVDPINPVDAVGVAVAPVNKQNLNSQIVGAHRFKRSPLEPQTHPMKKIRFSKKYSEKIVPPFRPVETFEAKVIDKRSADNYDESHKMSCPTIRNLQKRDDMEHMKDEVLQYMPEIASNQRHDDKNERTEVCENCGNDMKLETTGGNVFCQNCLAIGCTPTVFPLQPRPQYIEYNLDGIPVTYIPRKEYHPQHPYYQQQIPVQRNHENPDRPRIVYDKLGHKYFEHNGNLKIVTPDYIKYSRSDDYDDQMYLDKVREILYNHPDFHKWENEGNRKNGELAPPVLEQGTSFLEFLKDIVKNRHNDASNIQINIDKTKNESENDYYINNGDNDPIMGRSNDARNLNRATKENAIVITENNERIERYIDEEELKNLQNFEGMDDAMRLDLLDNNDFESSEQSTKIDLNDNEEVVIEIESMENYY